MLRHDHRRTAEAISNTHKHTTQWKRRGYECVVTWFGDDYELLASGQELNTNRLNQQDDIQLYVIIIIFTFIYIAEIIYIRTLGTPYLNIFKSNITFTKNMFRILKTTETTAKTTCTKPFENKSVC